MVTNDKISDMKTVNGLKYQKEEQTHHYKSAEYFLLIYMY